MRFSASIDRCSARCIRVAAAALMLMLLPIAAVHADEDDESREARVGELFILKFSGNREGGYRWRLNKEQSKGLDIVEVREIGWTIKSNKHQSLFFRELPILSISVLPKATGRAEIAFDYFRTWGKHPHSKTRTVRLVVLPAAR